MIFVWLLLIFSVICFLVSTSAKGYRASVMLIWLAVVGTLILALVFPNAGRGWF